MATVTDDEMRAGMATSRPYTVVILKVGPRRNVEGADSVIWEHGRRNFELRAEGRLPIVCPVLDDSEVSGIGILRSRPRRGP